MTKEPLALPHGPRHGDVLDLEVTALSLRGDGDARLDALIGPQRVPRRYTFLVARALPGDLIRVRVGSSRRGRVKSHLAEVLRPSPDRIEPRCRHFGVPGEDLERGCGGCTLQTLSVASQHAAKVALVRRLLGNAGQDPSLVLPPLGLEDPWRYRNKMEYSFGRDAEGRFALGMHPSGYKHDVLRLGECHLQSEGAERLLVRIRDWVEARGLEPFRAKDGSGFPRSLGIREGLRTGERLVEFVSTAEQMPLFEGKPTPAADVARAFKAAAMAIAREEGVAISSLWWTQHLAIPGQPTRFEEHLLDGSPVLREELHIAGAQPLSFEIHPRAFFQPTTRGAELLYGEVIRAAAIGGDSGEGSPPRVLDLYCGTGTIGIALAGVAEHVTGIELSPDAVANARDNARLNGISNITFHTGDVSKVLAAEGLDQPGRIDLVVVDPPRAGLLGDAVDCITRVAPARLVYVSCSPKSLARDLGPLRKAGYVVESIQPVDMFPQTAHVECVVALVRQPEPEPEPEPGPQPDHTL